MAATTKSTGKSHATVTTAAIAMAALATMTAAARAARYPPTPLGLLGGEKHRGHLCPRSASV